MLIGNGLKSPSLDQISNLNSTMPGIYTILLITLVSAPCNSAVEMCMDDVLYFILIFLIFFEFSFCYCNTFNNSISTNPMSLNHTSESIDGGFGCIIMCCVHNQM